MALTSVTAYGRTERAALTRLNLYLHYKDIVSPGASLKRKLAELRPVVEQPAASTLLSSERPLTPTGHVPIEMLRSIVNTASTCDLYWAMVETPVFQDKLKHLVYEVIAQRALHDSDQQFLVPLS